MSTDAFWAEKKSLERKSQNFIKTALELSGYHVMDYGIENHNQEIISKLKSSYKHKTNLRLLSMPDFVVYDPDDKKAHLVEAKYRNFKLFFDISKTNIAFRYCLIKQYMQYWSETVLILVMNTKPYCLCVDVKKMDWSIHFKGQLMINERHAEIWNFNGIYQLLNDKFPKVTKENFRLALECIL